MVQLSLDGDRFVLEVQGWDRVWALRSRLSIPLAHVKGAHVDPAPAMGWFDGVKLGGTDVPNVFRAGTFYRDRGFVFWDVHDPSRTIVIELHDERYSKLVVEVEDPRSAVETIEGWTRSAGDREKS